MNSATVTFGFKGLPYISQNYEGEKSFSQRAKVKRAFQKFGEIKRLYIDSNTGCGNVRIEVSSLPEVETLASKVIEAIGNSPLGMIKISWEQEFLDTTPEKDCFLPYKSWLFMNEQGSFSEIKAIHQEKLDFEQMVHQLEYEKYLDDMEVENLWDEWILQCEIDEVLTSACPDWDEDEIIKTNKRKYDEALVIPYEDFESSDEESDSEYELIETFTPVSGKTNFTIQEICEHIRLLAAASGQTSLSIDELVHHFGEKREYKRVPLVNDKNDYLPAHRRDAPSFVNNVSDAVIDLEKEFPKLGL